MITIRRTWHRGLRVATAALVAMSGCAPRVAARPDVPSEPPRAAVLRTSDALGCPPFLLIGDSATGGPLERISTADDLPQLVPPKSLQSSYDDYLDRRGAAAGAADAVTVEPAPEPPRVVSYRLPLGPHRLSVAEGGWPAVNVPLGYGGGGMRGEVAAILIGVGLFLMVADVLTRPALVVIDLEAEPDEVYLLHCDAEHAPWAWLSLEDDAVPPDSR
jgi:hypothetical protein